MKKTHSANIGGTVFQVEDDAYEKLQAYLHSIETHFQSYPDIADIVADIEGRIAEQLLQRELAPQVVRMVDVDRVIEAMGRIEQFAEPDTVEAAGTQSRKLFRDPDHKIISGVAAGLASYLGVPRLLVRIALLVLVMFFGTGVIAYLLLWALVPMASSTTDRLQMRGRPLTLAAIDQGVRDGIAAISPATGIATQGIMAAGSLIHLVVTGIARAIKWVAGVFVVGGATLGMLALTVMLVVALVNADAPPLQAGVSAFFASFGGWQIPFKVFVYLLVAIPLVLVFTTALKLFWGASRLNSRGLASLLGVWVVALLATATIWSSSYPQVKRFWDEYPATAEANRGVERFRAVVSTTSPLSDQQAKSLLATLTAEHKRRRAEEYRFSGYYYGGPLEHLEFEEEQLRTKEESDRRVIESARAYLDVQQLAVMEESATRRSTRMQAALQARRERLSGFVP